MKKPVVNPERRRFFKEATRTAGGLAGVTLLLGLQQKQSLAREGVALRPPLPLKMRKRFLLHAFVVVSVYKPVHMRCCILPH